MYFFVCFVFCGSYFPYKFFSDLNQLCCFQKATAFILFRKICSCWLLKHMQSTSLCRWEYNCLFTFSVHFHSSLLPLPEVEIGAWGRQHKGAQMSSLTWQSDKMALCIWGLWGISVGVCVSCLEDSLLGLWMWTIGVPLDADTFRSPVHIDPSAGVILPSKQFS